MKTIYTIFYYIKDFVTRASRVSEMDLKYFTSGRIFTTLVKSLPRATSRSSRHHDESLLNSKARNVAHDKSTMTPACDVKQWRI